MKTMYKIATVALVATALFGYSACSSEEKSPAENQQEVTFEFDAQTVIETKATIPGYAACNADNLPLSVQIKVSGAEEKTIIAPIKLFGANYKSDPLFFKSGSYKVEEVTVYNGSTIIYSGVQGGITPLPAFASFIPSGYLMGVQTFKVEDYTKPTVPLYVLCAKGENATQFGMPKFQINRIEVSCFDLFVNVCDANKEHKVGTGTIEVKNQAGTAVLWSDTFGPGNIGTLCFADDLTKDDSTEKYTVKFTLTNTTSGTVSYTYSDVTVAMLKAFKSSTMWDAQMNAIHVVACGEANPFAFFSGLASEN